MGERITVGATSGGGSSAHPQVAAGHGVFPKLPLVLPGCLLNGEFFKRRGVEDDDEEYFTAESSYGSSCGEDDVAGGEHEYCGVPGVEPVQDTRSDLPGGSVDLVVSVDDGLREGHPE